MHGTNTTENFTARVIGGYNIAKLVNYKKGIKNSKITVSHVTMKEKFDQKNKYAVATYTDNSVLYTQPVKTNNSY